MSAEDKVLFRSDEEEEDESEDDSWFDDLIERKLSDVPSEPLNDQMESCPDASQSLPMDVEIDVELPPGLKLMDFDTQPPDMSPPKNDKGDDVPDRPVARPLVGFEDIFDDPLLPPPQCLETIAIEDDELESPPKPAPSNTADRIAFLKAELAKLESQSQNKALQSRCGWGPALSKREVHI